MDYDVHKQHSLLHTAWIHPYSYSPPHPPPQTHYSRERAAVPEGEDTQGAGAGTEARAHLGGPSTPHRAGEYRGRESIGVKFSVYNSGECILAVYEFGSNLWSVPVRAYAEESIFAYGGKM